MELLNAVLGLGLAYVGIVVTFSLRMVISFFILMRLYNRGIPKWILYPLAVPFIVADVVLNYVVTILFLDVPYYWRETVSERLARYTYDNTMETGVDSYRYTISSFLCRVLSKADPNHCKNNLYRNS